MESKIFQPRRLSQSRNSAETMPAVKPSVIADLQHECERVRVKVPTSWIGSYVPYTSTSRYSRKSSYQILGSPREGKQR